MYQIDEGLHDWLKLVRLVAHDLFPTWREVILVCLCVPIPQAIVGSRHCERVTLLAHTQRLLRPLALGDVMADALILDDPAIGVEDGPVGPQMPADLPARRDDAVLMGNDGAFRAQRCQAPQNDLEIFVRYERCKFPAYQVLARLVEVSTVGVVHEGEGLIGQIAANQLGLILDDGAVPCLALAQGLLRPHALGDVLNEREATLYGAGLVDVRYV